MKNIAGHVAPVLLALGLWLVGNALMNVEVARGDDEVAGPSLYSCDPFVIGPKQYASPNTCVFDLQQYQCTGSCSLYYAKYETICNSFAVTGSTTKCIAPTVKDGAQQQDFYGICVPDHPPNNLRKNAFFCICVQGELKGNAYPVDGTVCSFPVKA